MSPWEKSSIRRFNLCRLFLKKISGALSRCLERPLPAYLTIVLLQERRVWGMFLHKDLPSGDTSWYFIRASAWARDFSADIVWSPLYTAYYGTFLKIFSDIYVATIAHHLVILLVLACLVLAVMRRLLPPEIAWFTAAWWVLMPVNFNATYEIHLFAVILPLLSVLTLLAGWRRWGRGIASALLLSETILVRNEFVVSLFLWTLVCIIFELRLTRVDRTKILSREVIYPYAVPLFIPILLTIFFSWRTILNPLHESFSRKHTLNMCQVYAFGYQQRHADWNKNPWTECQDLMLRDFGVQEPDIATALMANPSALLEHFSWNLRLVPAGLQLALFNASSGTRNPDYRDIPFNRLVIIPSTLLFALFCFGAWILWDECGWWWGQWFHSRIWGWTMLISCASVVLAVIPVERPRPSYMFMCSLFLTASAGMALYLLLHRAQLLGYLEKISGLLMLSLLLCSTSFFREGNRELLDMYRCVSPFAEYIGQAHTALIAPRYSQELCNYLAEKNSWGCRGYDYELFDTSGDAGSLKYFLGGQLPVTAIISLEQSGTHEKSQSLPSLIKDSAGELWRKMPECSAARIRLYLRMDQLERSSL